MVSPPFGVPGNPLTPPKVFQKQQILLEIPEVENRKRTEGGLSRSSGTLSDKDEKVFQKQPV